MISKNQLKRIKSLHQKKFRLEHNSFIIEGQKSVQEAISSGLIIECIVLQEGYESTHFDVQTFTASSQEMKMLSAMSTAPGILAVAHFPSWYLANPLPSEVTSSELILALDGIRDPGNLGTIIRTADWFGLKAIVATKDTVDCFNPKTVQASMGSVFRTPVYYTSMTDFLQETALPIYGLDLEGENLFEAKLSRGLFVLGNESHGIREDLSSLIQHQLHIPGKGDAESLNAAISAAIVMSHLKW
ncbi:MAG: RNA methyltransferase [Flavobacteriales bacterium]|nr:RNA methyltransferase [Flavobacteriales bacterium]MDG1780880.1 RNA methyltransferase [Flavobacteriales bacterium]MDG2245773.1 RNA methyltransferase [Flavobacteriales bacterium]